MAGKKLPHDHGQGIEKFADHLPQNDDFKVLSGVLKLMGDPMRLRVFWILCHCEECVTNISARTDMSSPAVSHHLRLLKSAGLITSERVGKEVYYTAAKTDQAQFLHEMIEDLAQITCPNEE